ncbi:substance-K receptor-like [Patiria miniata]|uniref:G-protein coupled receptors family 1 profile domain-containing protein n=1 Tax=Patiria miniata TaxID=46514 RepID=A0A914AST9_PATMI|nr:substance-K receptor-like [Patiria miniata]
MSAINSTQQVLDNKEPTIGKWVCQLLVAEGVIGVFGNLLVCLVILRVRFLHNMTNYLLVNLAVADMLLCLELYLLPLTLMSWAYYKIQVTLKRQAKALNLRHARAAAYDLVIARQRLVSMLTIVLGALIILWTPINITFLVCFDPTDKGPFPFCGSKGFKYFMTITVFLLYFNSVINPIIYELKYKKFRQGLKLTFCCCHKSHGANTVDIAMVPL